MEKAKIDVWLERINKIIQIILGVSAIFALALWQKISFQAGEIKLTAKLIVHGLTVLAFMASISGLSLSIAHGLISQYFGKKTNWWPIMAFFIFGLVFTYEIAYRLGYKD